MWYKNIAGRFFGLVTKHACDRRTDRQTYRRTDGQTDRIVTPKTALAQLRRMVKTGIVPKKMKIAAQQLTQNIVDKFVIARCDITVGLMCS